MTLPAANYNIRRGATYANRRLPTGGDTKLIENSNNGVA